MGVLTEFVRNEAEHLRGEATRREQAREEWLNALKKLTQMLSEWVINADAGQGLLSIQGQPRERHEALLGIYPVTSLSITLGGLNSGRTVEISPRARYVAGRVQPPGELPRRADGVVEIKSGGGAEYYLFRLAGENAEADRWFIRGVAQWNADPTDLKVDPLDRDHFEAALLQVLR